MSTVPKADTPPPANNAQTLTIGDGSGMYARPTAGGAAVGNNQGAGPGPAPGYSISMAGVTPGSDGTGAQVGPNMGHGATMIVAQPDATGHPSGDIAGGGTVGNSGSGLGQ